MIYAFDKFELDTTRSELRAGGAPVAIEPQVFALLRFLADNPGRLITKDEIVAQVWDGRFISDAAIASRIKSARQALGDDGRAQRFIRTVHGVGVRFEGAVRTSNAAFAPAQQAIEPETRSSRPTLAVLPFALLGDAGAHNVIADALPHDLITELSRLRWLFVIARASSFRFRGADADLDKVRAALNVRYCLSGAIEAFGGAMMVSVELSDTHSKGVIWSDQFRAKLEGAHEIRAEIVRAVIVALEYQIPLHEARRAQLTAPQHLDAWSAYHLGLQHMYRFTKADNATATAYFSRAAESDPNFARAYAGLSFTSFQDAFLRYADPAAATKLAQQHAERCLALDPADPFGNFTMGRAFWLRGELDATLPWLERAIALNPNYAQAKYSLGWTQAMIGEPATSHTNANAAMALSPLDPMTYAMLGVHALAHISSGEFADAASWADKAAHAPGAHPLIDMIAVAANGLSGSDDVARAWAKSARARAPALSRANFLSAFPFRSEATRAQITSTLERYGF